MNLEIVFRLQNHGQIPVKNIWAEIIVESVEDSDLLLVDEKWQDPSPAMKQKIPPGVEWITEKFIKEKWLRREQSAGNIIRIGLRVKYQDGYGRISVLEEYWKIQFFKSLKAMSDNSIDFTDKEESVLRIVLLSLPTSHSNADNSKSLRN